MKIINYTYLRFNLAEIFERVEKGETIEITRRGRQSIVLTPKTVSQDKTNDSLDVCF